MTTAKAKKAKATRKGAKKPVEKVLVLRTCKADMTSGTRLPPATTARAVC